MPSTDSSKYALVTGGSSGIGKAIAKELAVKGYSILIVSNNQSELDESLNYFESQNTICVTYYLNLATKDSAENLFEFVQSKNLNIEVLVNNAGILQFSEVCDTDNERLDLLVHLHMQTPLKICRLFGNLMREKKKGYILNVSSISSVMPFPGISVYGPTKTFIRYFTQALRQELMPHGVYVTCLIPGATETQLYDPNRVNLKMARNFGIMASPEFVASKAITALFNNKATCIPGIINKLTMIFVPFIPSFLIQYIHIKSNLTQLGKKSLANN